MTRLTGSSFETLPTGIVTAMFTDIVESTKLKNVMAGESAGRRDAAYRSGVKEPHDRRVLERVRGAGGHKVKSTGDGFLFTFSDADEAVLCALALQESFQSQPIETPLGPLRLRIGIHTGSATPTDEEYTASTIDKAARLHAEAGPGEVVLSQETRVIVHELHGVSFEELSTLELKGLGRSTLYRASRAAGPDSAASLPSSPPLSDMENPYDFATTANHKTFKGRASETEELLDSIEAGTHTAIFGLQRMGKTSLIEQGLRAELDERKAVRDSVLIATIDMQRLGGMQVTYRDFAHAIFDAIITQIASEGLGREIQNLRALIRDVFAANQYQRGDRTEFFVVFSKLLSDLASASKRRIVLFIDEFSEIRRVIERNKAATQKNPGRTSNLLPHDMYVDVFFIHHLSSLLKDESLKRRITFIVLVRPFIAEYDEREGLQLLKLMKPITLSRLDEAAAKELITKPLETYLSYEEGAVDYLYTLTAGHPYLLQFILKLIVDKIKRSGRPKITVNDIKWVQERMISDGPAFDAQFKVLISDYSVDEITHPKEAELGRGMLALVSKLGQHSERWVSASQIFDGFARYKIPEEKTSSLLSQLTRTRILEDHELDGQLHYRLSIPLVHERFVRQNLYLKYFRYA